MCRLAVWEGSLAVALARAEHGNTVIEKVDGTLAQVQSLPTIAQ